MRLADMGLLLEGEPLQRVRPGAAFRSREPFSKRRSFSYPKPPPRAPPTRRYQQARSVAQFIPRSTTGKSFSALLDRGLQVAEEVAAKLLDGIICAYQELHDLTAIGALKDSLFESTH
jgi:hypothetical protein